MYGEIGTHNPKNLGKNIDVYLQKEYTVTKIEIKKSKVIAIYTIRYYFLQTD